MLWGDEYIRNVVVFEHNWQVARKKFIFSQIWPDLPIDIDWESVTSEDGEAFFALFDEFQHILKFSVKNCMTTDKSTLTPRRSPSVFSFEAFLAHLKMRLVSFFEAIGVEMALTSFTCSEFSKVVKISKSKSHHHSWAGSPLRPAIRQGLKFPFLTFWLSF